MRLDRRLGYACSGAIAVVFAALSGCAPVPPPKPAEVPLNRIYVANESSNTVTVIDGTSFNGDSASINVPTGSLSVGTHTVAVTVSGTCGSASQSATLTVQENTSTSDPADSTVCQGATAGFSTTSRSMSAVAIQSGSSRRLAESSPRA